MRNRAATSHPDLLVGVDGSDDAGVFRLSEDLALVQSVDYLTPIVDEAFDWGRIAAANALSDIYTMGGVPLTALQIVGWPRESLPFDLLGEVLDGGLSVLEEAGVTLVGGHSLDDPEPKYGMAVTGTVHPERIVTNAGARPGDKLVLTKPLGTGVISTAIKAGEASQEVRGAAVAAMTALNRGAAEAMKSTGVNAATDVTGFGLLGHLGEVITASGVGAVVSFEAVPLLPGAHRFAEKGVLSAGSRRNRRHVDEFTDFGDAEEAWCTLLSDAQTSGGLLIAVEAARTGELVAALQAAATPAAAVIGEITDESGRITVA